MKKLLLLLALSALTGSGYGQGRHKIDSLKHVLIKLDAKKSALSDTTRTALLNKLCRAYLGVNNDTAILYGQQELALSEKIGFKKGIANAYNNRSNAYLNQKKYEQAIDGYEKAIKIRGEIGDTDGMGKAVYNLGVVALNQNNLPEGLKNYHAAIKLFEKVHDNQFVVNCYNNIGAYYFGKNKFDDAITNYKEALKVWEKAGDKKGIATSYEYIADTYDNKQDYPNALTYFQLRLKACKEIGELTELANAYQDMGYVYNQMIDYSDALKNYKEELKVKEKMGDKKAVALIYNFIGSDYSSMNNFPEALKNHQLSLKINEDLGDSIDEATAYNNIGYVYDYMENYAEALKNFRGSLKIQEAIKDTNGAMVSHINIGWTLCKEGTYPEALVNENTALAMAQHIKDNSSIAVAYLDIGLINLGGGNYNEALKNLFNSVKFAETNGEISVDPDTYNTIGIVYDKLGDLQNALRYETKGRDQALAINNKAKLKDSYEELAKINSKLQNYKAAYANLLLYKLTNDTIYSKANQQKFTSLQMQYGFDKEQDSLKTLQAKKDALKEKEKAVAAAELKNQKRIRNFTLGGLAVVIFFLVFVFIQRNKIAKEKKRSEELLLNILPSEVADELKDTGSAKAKRFDEVTVMFTDFKGFTQISEKLTPEQLVAEIDYCFRGFDKIIEKYGIEKIKTIGDSYMCAGGLPVKNVTNPDDVVKAAIEIRDFMVQHKNEKLEKGEPPFEIRIGVHTGPVVAGIVGVKKFAYDIWGDTVNLASRMESSGVEGQVNISDSTYQLVKDKFTCTHRGKVQTKSKGEVDMYFVS